ncbi:MAG: hypothetical protein FJY85_00275 [Deltaproteobacteria bacterium]|nr:hypothetical protein [Deltaproteobacteria bacterium]
MIYRLSKNDWVEIGKKTGWLKTAYIHHGYDGGKLMRALEGGDLKSFVDSIEEENAQMAADTLHLERDIYAYSLDQGFTNGDTDTHVPSQKETILVGFIEKLSKILEMMKDKFPNIKTKDPTEAILDILSHEGERGAHRDENATGDPLSDEAVREAAERHQ